MKQNESRPAGIGAHHQRGAQSNQGLTAEISRNAHQGSVAFGSAAPSSAAMPGKSSMSAPPKAVDSGVHTCVMSLVGTPDVAVTPKTATTPALNFDLSELREGELYAGVVSIGGIFQHLILLPAEARGVNWQQAKTFAAAVGGELPDLGDYEVLLQNLQQEFAGDDVYWSSEWLDRKQALYLDFGTDPFRDWESVDALMRARAVRRIFAGREQSVVINWHKHIKVAREAAGVTPDRLAQMVGVTPAIIAQWESGEVRTISGPDLMNVCTVLNVDPGWLLGADDE